MMTMMLININDINTFRNIEQMKHQLHLLGLSFYDADGKNDGRVTTCQPEYYKWTQVRQTSLFTFSKRFSDEVQIGFYFCLVILAFAR